MQQPGLTSSNERPIVWPVFRVLVTNSCAHAHMNSQLRFAVGYRDREATTT
jgi:hypothetical protein